MGKGEAERTKASADVEFGGPSDAREIDQWIDEQTFETPRGGEIVVHGIESFNYPPAREPGQMAGLHEALGRILSILDEEAVDPSGNGGRLIQEDLIELVKAKASEASEDDLTPLRNFIFLRASDDENGDVS